MKFERLQPDRVTAVGDGVEVLGAIEVQVTAVEEFARRLLKEAGSKARVCFAPRRTA